MSAASAVVDLYLRYVANHDLAGALSCLSPDFELEFAGAGFKMSKEQAAAALDWDVGANGRLAWETVGESNDTVEVRGEEGNDFLDLLGIGSLTFRSVFKVASTGRITHQLHDVTWGAIALPDAMAPLVAWASVEEPEELGRIYPEGRMSYTGAMAVRWVSLARRWRSRTSRQE